MSLVVRTSSSWSRMPVPPGTRGSHPLLRPQQDIRPGVQHEIADEPQAPKLRRKIGSILQSIIQGAYPGERLKECAEPASAPCGDESPSRHRAWLKPVASRESGTCVLRFTAMRLEPNAAPVARGRFHNRFQPRFRDALVRATPLVQRWAHLGSNQGPPACEAGALPLSYAPGR
jgi:hypothetical protein